MEPADQLKTYIQQSLTSGLSPEAVAQQLRQSGWPEASIQESLRIQSLNSPQLSTELSNARAGRPHNARDGILWILSPFILLVGVALLQLLIELGGIHSAIINILSILAGIDGVILIPLGLIVGIIKLSKH